MNKEIMAQILPIVEKTKEGILKGVEIAQQQVPELIQEILKWNFTVSLVWFIVGVIGMSVTIYCLIRILKTLHSELKKDMTDLSEEGAYNFSIFIPTGIVAFLFGCNVFVNYEWLQIMIAPKLFLIEYISNLLK